MKETQQGTLQSSSRQVDLKQSLSRFQRWCISISRSLPLKRTRLPPSLGIHRDFYQQHQPSPPFSTSNTNTMMMKKMTQMTSISSSPPPQSHFRFSCFSAQNTNILPPLGVARVRICINFSSSNIHVYQNCNTTCCFDCMLIQLIETWRERNS